MKKFGHTINKPLPALVQLRANEKYLKDLSRDEFIKRLAYYMSELNVLHPFREGNGRTIREFIRELAYVNGYIFDLKDIDPEDMLNASIKSVFDTTDLEKILDKCLTKRRIRKFLICLFLQMCYNFGKRY